MSKPTAICQDCWRRYEPKRFVQHRDWRTNGKCTFCGGGLWFHSKGWFPQPWKRAR